MEKAYIGLNGILNLDSFNQQMKKSNLDIVIKSTKKIIFNFNDVSMISTFAIFDIILLINKIIEKYKIQCEFEFDDANKRVKTTLSEFFHFFGNEPQIISSNTAIRTYDSTVRNFISYKFNRRQFNTLDKNLSGYLHQLKNMFPSYLDRYITISYESAIKTYQKIERRLSKISYLNMLIMELLDNIIIHSESIGYLRISLNNYCLYLLIGDTGIGLRNGLLKRYNLNDRIKNDIDAFNTIFYLEDYRNFRHDFYNGAGYGLRDALEIIFRLRGKFLMRTHGTFAGFMNPVKKSRSPSKIFESYINVSGTQYYIVLPLSNVAIDSIPSTSGDMLKL